MDEIEEAVGKAATTPEDRMWAALSWIPISPLWPIVAILALLMEDTKNRPFVRTNAVLSIATGLVLIPVSILTIGCGAVLYLVFFYWAYLAYQGQEVTIPVVSDWVKKQGWV